MDGIAGQVNGGRLTLATAIAWVSVAGQSQIIAVRRCPKSNRDLIVPSDASARVSRPRTWAAFIFSYIATSVARRPVAVPRQQVNRVPRHYCQNVSGRIGLGSVLDDKRRRHRRPSGSPGTPTHLEGARSGTQSACWAFGHKLRLIPFTA